MMPLGRSNVVTNQNVLGDNGVVEPAFKIRYVSTAVNFTN